MKRVFMDGWQIECCGEPFEVGDLVTWTVVDSPDPDSFLASAFGTELADSIDFDEDHHDMAEHSKRAVTSRELVGWVEGIQAAFCSFTPSDRDHYPVPGSGVLESRRGPVDGNEPGDLYEHHFIGYLVDINDRTSTSGT